MKTTLLLSIIFLFLFAGCKEENDVQPEKYEINQMLKGNWSNNFRVEEYYNDANEIAYKDTATVDVRFEFDGKFLKITNPGVDGVESLTYSVPDTSKTNYIVVTRSAEHRNIFEIVSISETKMVWKKTVDWAGYPNGNGGFITSRKGIYLYEFKKL